MCLYIPGKTRPVSKIAKRNIYVYKILRSFSGIPYSPYHSYPWRLNRKQTAKGSVELFKSNHWEYYVLEGGVFHTYVHEGDAVDMRDLYNVTGDIYKVMIPKGTRYWTGNSTGYKNSGRKQYASKSLVIVNRV